MSADARKQDDSPEERMEQWMHLAQSAEDAKPTAGAPSGGSATGHRRTDPEEAVLDGADHLPFLTNHSEVLEILMRLETALGAQSVSLFAANPDGRTLAVLGTRGPIRPAGKPKPISMDRSPAGRALESGDPVIERGAIPQAIEDDRNPRDLYRASVPVRLADRPAAVLNATIELEHGASDDDFLPALEQAATDLGPILLRAVNLAALDPGRREDLVLLQIDRALARQDTLHARLQDTANVVANAFAASFCQVYLADPAGQRLKLISAPKGGMDVASRYQDARSGLLGWLAGNEGPTYLCASDVAGKMLHGQVGIPIRIKERLHSLFLVDSVSSPVGEKVALLALAGRCGAHIETILDVESSVEVSNRSTQLRTWLADSLPLIRKLRGSTRIASILKFAAELLGGEVAVWYGTRDEDPLAGPPVAANGFDLLARTWKTIPELTEWIRRDDVEGWRSNLVKNSGGPKLDTGYIGVQEPRSKGILIVLFGPEAESPEDPESLVDLLSVLCREIEPAAEGEEPEPASPGRVVDVDSFRLHIEREWNRSLRFGHFFSITRFEPVSDGDAETLHEFLAGEKRVVDIMAGGEKGMYYFLTPETENDPEGVKIRLAAQWLQLHPSTPLKIDQMIFPVDGEHCDGYIDWVRGKTRAA